MNTAARSYQVSSNNDNVINSKITCHMSMHGFTHASESTIDLSLIEEITNTETENTFLITRHTLTYFPIMRQNLSTDAFD